MKITNLRLIEIAIRIFLVVILLLSSFSSLSNLYQYGNEIHNYRILDSALSMFAAAFFPFVELTVAITLLFGRTKQRSPYLILLILFSVFFLAQLSAIYRGLNISCGCFGTSHESKIGWKSISLVLCCLICSGVGFYGAKLENRHAN